MDMQEQRMQCLRMAIELGGKPELVLAAAKQLLGFVTGNPQPVEAATGPAVRAEPIAMPQPEPQHAHESAVGVVVADPIAACGTALVMPDGGDLATATSNPELPPAAVEIKSQPASEGSEAVAAHIENEAPAETPVVAVVETVIAEGVVTDSSAEAAECVADEQAVTAGPPEHEVSLAAPADAIVDAKAEAESATVKLPTQVAVNGADTEPAASHS